MRLQPGFPGLASGFATTTAMVVDRPGVTEDDLRDAVFDWMDRGGWIDLFEQAAHERRRQRATASSTPTTTSTT